MLHIESVSATVKCSSASKNLKKNQRWNIVLQGAFFSCLLLHSLNWFWSLAVIELCANRWNKHVHACVNPVKGKWSGNIFPPFFFSFNYVLLLLLLLFKCFFPLNFVCLCVCVCVCVCVRVCALRVHISPPTHSSEGKESVPWNWGSKCDKQYWRNKPDKPPTDRTTVEFLGGDGGRGINYRSAYDCATVSVFIWSKGQQLTTVLKVFCMAVQSF